MKLAVINISTSENHVTGTASIYSNLLWATFPFCSFEVCVDRVDGKSLEQYENELLEKARERIREIYKEIVCGGELDNEIIIPVCGNLTGEYGIKVANKNGKLSVVGLVGKDSDMLGLLRNEIKPSELSHESLAEVDKASTSGAMKPFLVEDGKIVMNAKHFTLINSTARDNLEERVALLEKHLHDAQINPDVLNAIHANIKKAIMDDSLVVRDADGSVRVRMNAEKQAGLKVTVSDKDDVLWMRDSATLEGIMSLGYLKDGTQQRIITALEDALEQAKGQMSCWSDDSVRVSFPTMRPSRIENKVDSVFDYVSHCRIGGNIQIKLPSGELATIYYEEDLDPKSTFGDYLCRAKEHARKSVKAH